MTPTKPPSYKLLDDNLDTSPIALCLLTTPTSPQQTPPQITPQTTLQTNPQTTSQSTHPTPLSTPSPQTTPTPPTTPPPPPPPPTLQHPMVTRSKVRIVKANPKYNLHVTTSSPIPKSPFYDLRDPNRKQAMCDEYKALIDNNIWVLVPCPPNVNIVRSMWLYKHKYNVDGSLNWYKARLVANGRSQQQGIDYDETFSPIVKPATIRTPKQPFKKLLGMSPPNLPPLRRIWEGKGDKELEGKGRGRKGKEKTRKTKTVVFRIRSPRLVGMGGLLRAYGVRASGSVDCGQGVGLVHAERAAGHRRVHPSTIAPLLLLLPHCLLTTLTSPQQTPTQTTPQTTLQTNPQTTSQSTPPTPLSTPSPQTTPTPPTTPPPPPPTTQHPMVTRSKVRIVKANPKYNLHDLRDPNWKQAMCDEYKALIDNNIWVLVPRPPNVNIVCSMWLYKHKYNADGSLNRYKARLVANGRSQQQGIDYDETFSPVVKPATIRTVLGLAEPNTAYLLLYVDDIILTASSTSLLQRIISLLHAEFAIADLGPFNYFLGISATRTTSGIFLTPIDTEKKLGPEGSLVTDPTLYCNLAESLQYLTFTRPNLSYAIQQLCLYMHDPREPHLNAMKCILCYPATRRSTSRYCVFLGDNLLTWSSKCQDMLSRSSVEAKYRGVTNAIAETSWICNLRCELHTPLFTATLVYYDNVSAVYMSANLVQHQRSKHIEIDIHFIRGKLAAGHV
ncbi:ribonuclease H-like domain-containing protein [Tanacetum coccineum]